MAAHLSDRWLWLGVGVFLFAAAKGIQYALTETVRLTELDADQYPAEQPGSDQPEASIPLSTLRTLLRSPNESIVSTVQELVVRRFLSQPDAAAILSRDSRSSDSTVRRRAKQAIAYLDLDMDHAPASHYDHPAAPDTPDSLPDLGPNRAAHIRAAEEAAAGVWDMIVDERISETQRARGRQIVERLEELNQELASFQDAIADQMSRNETRFAGWDQIPHQRPNPAGGDLDEAERRRRRREAMVLHEGGGRIGEEDIIRPRGR